MHTIISNYNCTLSQRRQEQGLPEGRQKDPVATMVAVLPQHQSQASRALWGLLWVQQAPGKGKITSKIQDRSRKHRHFSPLTSQGRNMSREGGALSQRQPLKSPDRL